MLVPLMAAEWLRQVLYFCTEYHNSRKNILILFWKYVVDIRSAGQLNLFGKYSMENCLQSRLLLYRRLGMAWLPCLIYSVEWMQLLTLF
jgi:hypothetical protein